MTSKGPELSGPFVCHIFLPYRSAVANIEPSGGRMHEQKKTQKALVLGWSIGLALVAVMVVAKLVLKF